MIIIVAWVSLVEIIGSVVYAYIVLGIVVSGPGGAALYNDTIVVVTKRAERIKSRVLIIVMLYLELATFQIGCKCL